MGENSRVRMGRHVGTTGTERPNAERAGTEGTPHVIGYHSFHLGWLPGMERGMDEVLGIAQKGQVSAHISNLDTGRG